MAHEVLEGSPHKVDMVTGAFRDPNIDEDLKLRHGLKEYRDAVVDSAMLQGDLMSGTGQTMLKVLKEIYEKRLDELAQADSQIRAIEAVLAALGHVIIGAPAVYHRAVRHYLGPDVAIPFDPLSELYEATARDPGRPGGT